MRLDRFRAALFAFFERRAAELERNAWRYTDHKALWLARKAELELVRQFARVIETRIHAEGEPMTNLKLWLMGAWRSRTMWAALGVMVAGLVQVIRPQAIVSPAVVGWMLMAIGAGIMALRVITTGGLLDKVPGTGPAPNPTMGPPK